MLQWDLDFTYLNISVYCRKESTFLLQGGMIQGFNLGFFFISQLFMTFILLTVYTSSGGDLSPKKIFTTVSLLFGLRVTAVIRFAVNIIYMSEAKVAISRLQVSWLGQTSSPADIRYKISIVSCHNVICTYGKLQKLLEMEELVSSSLTNEMCSNNSAQVQVKNLSVSWSCDKKNLVLESVSFEVDQVHKTVWSITVVSKITYLTISAHMGMGTYLGYEVHTFVL